MAAEAFVPAALSMRRRPTHRSLAVYPRRVTMAAVPVGQPRGSSEGRTHVMATISFEGLVGVEDNLPVLDGYRNLNWSNFWAIDNVLLEERIGNSNAIRTGKAAAFSFPE